jgi:hypothetical protein
MEQCGHQKQRRSDKRSNSSDPRQMAAGHAELTAAAPAVR